MIHALCYPSTKSNSGGDLIINKLKNKKKVYDIFPPSKDLKKHKKYKVEKNFCIFILNVPWSYHSVDKYKGSEERKYLYFVYDLYARFCMFLCCCFVFVCVSMRLLCTCYVFCVFCMRFHVFICLYTCL